MRRRTAWALLAALAALALAPAGCGGRFELPTEQPHHVVPTDQSYAMLDTWRGMDGIQDVIFTQGESQQLFALFNHGGTGGPSVPRGEVRLYQRNKPQLVGAPFFFPMQTLFNPVAITYGSNPQALFVLDQGDSCLAKKEPQSGLCAPDAGHQFRSQIYDYTATWRVREYDLDGGDTISTFTDTTFAQTFGIAADNQGRVYVSGLVVVLDTSQTDQRIRTRKAVSRVYRYKRGLRYPGVLDVNMPGTTAWHRDTTWLVFDGTGASSVSDPRGIDWSPLSSTPLYIADRGNNQGKSVSSNAISFPIALVDGSVTGLTFDRPEGVRADRAGFFYAVDRGNSRVLRFSNSGEYIQRVDIEENEDGDPLQDPVSIAVDDSLAWIADRGRGQIIRYKRRP